jgi:hypothetical protein
VNFDDLLPLERRFKEVAAAKIDQFPDRTNYWDRYWSMLSALRTAFYPNINVGLAANSGSIAGIYTDHSEAHFNEVVKYAGKLLGIDSGDERALDVLRPFEIYLLLMGIRLHDAGNLYGRTGHEKRAMEVYKATTPQATQDKFEAKVVAKIAEFHGGLTQSGSKDTISQLKENDSLGSSSSFRPRMIAALVRFADEICEHRGRISQHMIDSGAIPQSNLLFHQYAAAIKASVVDRAEKLVSIEYEFHRAELTHKFDTPSGGDRYLLDETLDRIQKLNLERLYCNQFLDPLLQINRLRAAITIVDGTDGHTTIDSRVIEIKPEGYPTDSGNWRSQASGFSGAEMCARLAGERS